jgi:hypothetical protein
MEGPKRIWNLDYRAKFELSIWGLGLNNVQLKQ